MKQSLPKAESTFDIRIGTVGLVAVMYILACVTPIGGDPSPEYFGLQALLVGWMVGWPGSNFQAGFPGVVPWSANWCLLAGWIFLLKKKFTPSVVFGTTASVLAFFTWATAIPHLLIGYYLWHGSMIALTVGSMKCRIAEQEQTDGT